MADFDDLWSLREIRRRLRKPEWATISTSLDAGLLRKLQNYDYGLTTEEEFHYILRLLGQSDVRPIVQSRTKSAGPIPADYSVTFSKNLSFPARDDSIPALVEVKRAWEFRWRITQKDFARRLRYARNKKSRLLFALKFASTAASFWTLFSARYVERQNYKLGVDDIRNSLFDVLTRNVQLSLPSCTVETVFERGFTSVVKHPQRGGLKRLKISIAGNVAESESSPLWRLVLYAFHPASRTEKRTGDLTMISTKYESQLAPLYHAVDSVMYVFHGLKDETEHSAFRVDWLNGRVRSPIDVNVVAAVVADMTTAGVLQPFRLMPHDVVP